MREMLSSLMEAKAKRFDELAGLIANDPEWFADDSVDDAELIEALNIAAEMIRSKIAHS